MYCTAEFCRFIHERLEWLQSAPFTFLGMISYSLYLIHQAIAFDIIWRAAHDAHWNSTAVMRWVRDWWKLRWTMTSRQHD